MTDSFDDLLAELIVETEGSEAPSPQRDAEWEEIGRLPNGCTLYRSKGAVGGYDYWSDEIGGGVHVWSTALVERSTLLAALTEEERRVRAGKP